MRGTVRVAAAPTPTPDALGDACSRAPARRPEPHARPAGPTITPQTSLKVTLASGQRGTRVRGRVEVRRAGVTAGGDADGAARARRAPRPHLAGARVSVSFSVPLNAKGRRTLRSRKRLEVTVRSR